MREFKEILEHCAKTNTPEFNRNKALEEATEFMEAMLKRETKSPTNPKRPLKKESLTEYGDFMYRGMIYLMTEFPNHSYEAITEMVNEHIAEKLNKLIAYKRSGKYEGGL